MRTGLKIWTKKRMNNETVTMKAQMILIVSPAEPAGNTPTATMDKLSFTYL